MAGEAWQRWMQAEEGRRMARRKHEKTLDVVVRVEERKSWMLHEADAVERARAVVVVGEAEEVSDRVRGRRSGKRSAQTAKRQSAGGKWT